MSKKSRLFGSRKYFVSYEPSARISLSKNTSKFCRYALHIARTPPAEDLAAGAADASSASACAQNLDSHFCSLSLSLLFNPARKAAFRSLAQLSCA